MRDAGTPSLPRRCSRRAVLRAALVLAVPLLAAACAPTRSLAPSKAARTDVAASSSPESTRGQSAVARPTASPHVARPAEATATPPVSASNRRTGTPVVETGREYLAYPDTSGVVQFSNCWDNARTPLIEAAIAELGAICPGIKVENDVNGCDSLRERQVTALASGSPPNVMMLKSDSTAFLAEQGALLPLDELMARDRVRPDWFRPAELQARIWEGKTYGLPNATAAAQHLLIVNTGLLEKLKVDPAQPIRTWQDLDALVEPARRAGLRVLDPIRIAIGMTGHQVWTYANGGRYWDDGLRSILWDDEPGVEAATWLRQFVAAQTGTFVGTAPGGSTAMVEPEEWGAEQYVCCIGDAGWPFRARHGASHVRLAVYDFPRNAANPASTGATPSTGGWMLSIPRAARDQAAAWEWVKMMTVGRSACTFAERQERPAPLVDCPGATHRSGDPTWTAVTSALSKSVAVPTSPIHPRLEQVYRDMQSAILTDWQAPRDVVEAYARTAQQLLDEWQSKRRRA